VAVFYGLKTFCFISATVGFAYPIASQMLGRSSNMWPIDGRPSRSDSVKGCTVEELRLGVQTCGLYIPIRTRCWLETCSCRC
jgi:hypothetical protein